MTLSDEVAGFVLVHEGRYSTFLARSFGGSYSRRWLVDIVVDLKNCKHLRVSNFLSLAHMSIC